jgi:hypothetical protein
MRGRCAPQASLLPVHFSFSLCLGSAVAVPDVSPLVLVLGSVTCFRGEEPLAQSRSSRIAPSRVGFAAIDLKFFLGPLFLAAD